MLNRTTILLWLLLMLNKSELSAISIHIPEDYPTINEAYLISQGGDTLIVNGGQFNESLKITHPLTLIGSNTDSTVITGSDSLPSITIETNDVILQDLFIRGRALENSNLEKAVFISNSGNITITNVDITGGASSIDQSTKARQDGNIALHIIKSNDISIVESKIAGGTAHGDGGRGSYGIYMDDISNISIINSNITGGSGSVSGYTADLSPKKYGGDAISINNSTGRLVSQS